MIQLNLNTGTGNAADSSRNDVSMSGAPLPAAVEGTGALSPAMSPILGPIDAPKDAWIDILESEITSEQQQHQQQQQQQQQQQAIYNSLMHPSMMVTNQDVQQQLQQQQQHLFQQQQQQQSQTQRQSNPQYVTQYTIQPVIQPHPSQQPLFHAASMPSLQTLQSLGVPMPLNLAATQPGAFPSVSVPVSAPAATPDPATATSPAGAVPAGPVPAPDAAGCTSDPALARDKKKKTASEERAALRVERKRDREKRRREDVNSQFDELSALLRRIAPLPGDKKMEGGTETPGVTMPSSAMLAGPSNRADLLQRTCAVLQEAHDERVSLREQCTDLRRRLIESKTAGCSCSGGSGLQHHVSSFHLSCTLLGS